MKTIITACCPFGNLEKVLLILQQAGLEVDREFFALLHDKLVGDAYSGDPFETNHNVLQGSLLENDITSILVQSETGPRLLTDSRCLWLLDFWAKKLPEAKFLLFYTHAESALAYACRHEIDPQQALKTWQDSSRHLLNFQRYHRRRSLLLDADAAIRQPQALIDICQLIGLTLEEYLPQSEAQVLDQAILERYLAHNLIASQPEVQSLQIELDASAQPLGNLPVLEIEPLEVFNKLSQRLAQQRKLQDESDQLTKALDNQRNLNAEQQARLENVQQSHQTLETTTAAVTQENELLLLQLEMVQEELERSSVQGQHLEQQVEKDKVIQQQFQAQIDHLSQARDEQLKSSADQQTMLENVQQSHQLLEATAKEVTQKNENLAKQLSQVQEQLVRSSVQRQQLEQQTKENQAIAQHFQAQVAQLSRARDEQVKLNTEQQAKLEKAQHSHQSLQATISKLDTTVQEITRKKEQLLLQLDQVLAELKKTLIERQQLEQQAEKDKVIRRELEAQGDRLSRARDEQVKLNTEHQAKLDRMQQSNKTLQATAKEVSQKNEHLLKQLHRVQEELEKIFLQKKQLEQQAEKNKVIRQELEAQVDRLSQAREEQLNLNTEQKAKLENVQQAHQKLDENVREITQENELLLEQLHQVQEELERTYLHKQQLERQAHHDLETIKNEKDQELKKAKDQLKQAKDEIIHTKDELKQAKVELTNKSRDLEKYHLHEIVREKSLAWKISTPMRAIAKPFKKKSRDQESIQEQIDLLRDCGLFDEAWYIAANEDIAKEGSDPIEHYIRFGAAEGRDPSPVFSTRGYLEKNPDVVEAGMNPLVHYARYGMAEKRFKKLSKEQGSTEEQVDLLRTCGLFDEAWYVAANADVAREGCDPIEHYIRFGAAEGRDPSPVFSTRSYLEHNPDVAEAGMNPLVHYAKYGMAEKRFIGQL